MYFAAYVYIEISSLTYMCLLYNGWPKFIVIYNEANNDNLKD